MKRKLALGVAAFMLIAPVAQAVPEGEQSVDLNKYYWTPKDAFIAPRADVPTVLEAPYYAWGLRTAIRKVKKRVDIKIIYRRGATCEEYPNRRCLRAFKHPTPERIFAWYSYNDHFGAYNIYFNPTYMAAYGNLYKKEASAHEFGHFLGFAHHHDPLGMMGSQWSLYTQPSRSEYRVLRNYYGRR